MASDEQANTQADETSATGDESGARTQEAGGDSEVESKTKDKSKDAKSSEKRYTQSDIDRIADKIAERMRREADEKLDKERKAADKKRLESEGKWKELAEKAEAEKEALLAEKRRNEFRESARGVLKDKGLSNFEEILLAEHSSTERIGESADALNRIINDIVEEKVRDRLDTGKRPKGEAKQDVPWGEMTKDEWQQKKQELGIF